MLILDQSVNSGSAPFDQEIAFFDQVLNIIFVIQYVHMIFDRYPCAVFII
jgi:hypothetical protein